MGLSCSDLLARVVRVRYPIASFPQPSQRCDDTTTSGTVLCLGATQAPGLVAKELVGKTSEEEAPVRKDPKTQWPERAGSMLSTKTGGKSGS